MQLAEEEVENNDDKTNKYVVEVVVDLMGSLSTLENSGFCHLRKPQTDRRAGSWTDEHDLS